MIIALAHHKRRPVAGSKPIGVRAAAVITFDRAGKVATARLHVDVAVPEQRRVAGCAVRAAHEDPADPWNRGTDPG